MTEVSINPTNCLAVAVEEPVEHFFSRPSLKLGNLGLDMQALCGTWIAPVEDNLAGHDELPLHQQDWRPTPLDPYDCTMCVEIARGLGIALMEYGT